MKDLNNLENLLSFVLLSDLLLMILAEIIKELVRFIPKDVDLIDHTSTFFLQGYRQYQIKNTAPLLAKIEVIFQPSSSHKQIIFQPNV